MGRGGGRGTAFGGRIDLQFFILFTEVGSIQLIFVTGLILKVIEFLGVQLWVAEEICNQENEIKTKDLNQRTLPAFILCHTFNQKDGKRTFPAKRQTSLSFC